MASLRVTPDVDGLPNLERLMLDNCGSLEEIHPSIGRSERLLFLEIETCYSLITVPPLTSSKKLETLKILYCRKLFKVLKIQKRHLDMTQREVSSFERFSTNSETQQRVNLYMTQSEVLSFKRYSMRKPTDLDMTEREVSPYKQYCTNLRKWLLMCCCNNFGGYTKLMKPDYGTYPEFRLDDLSLPHNNIICLDDPSLPHHNISHIGLQLIHKGLRKLYIDHCELENGDIEGVVGELPNLEELDLSGNKFSRLNFQSLQLPRLKWLKVSYCDCLEELLGLPSSIAVLRADSCCLLKDIRDISSFKWLWKLSFKQYGMDHVVGRILDINGQGNAIEDHFISLTVPVRNIQKERVINRLVKGERFALQLPAHDKPSYDDFCGFFICVVTRIHDPVFTIILKPVIGMDFQSDISESNEATVPYSLSPTYVGYVSFNLLKRHTPHWDSAYSKIFISVTGKSMRTNNSMLEDEISFRAALIPRKSKGLEVQTNKVASDCSEYWDEEFEDRKTFTIQHDSNSSIKIVWHPY